MNLHACLVPWLKGFIYGKCICPWNHLHICQNNQKAKAYHPSLMSNKAAKEHAQNSKHPSWDEPIDLLGMSCGIHLVCTYRVVAVCTTHQVQERQGLKSVTNLWLNLHIYWSWKLTLFAMWDCILMAGIAPEIEDAAAHMTCFAHLLPMMIWGYCLHWSHPAAKKSINVSISDLFFLCSGGIKWHFCLHSLQLWEKYRNSL